ncbi:hypothetical protein HD554DRAFT_2167345 [Boletus coccyginus]|nr:hypothetical protein HD554DRAFT_2167345 [Boletus coccyginus]
MSAVGWMTWWFGASTILEEQALDDAAHPSMISDQPPPEWYSEPWRPWPWAASTILKDQVFEDEAQNIAGSEVLSY